MCFIRTDKKLFDSLNRPLELNNVDKSLWSDKCDYLDPVLCMNFYTDNFNFIVMQLNIRSILAHQNELRQLLQTMANKNSQVDVLLLCETFLTIRTEKLGNILGYSLITNNSKDHKGGGVAMLIRHGITFRKWNDLNIMKEKTIVSVKCGCNGKKWKHFYNW